MMDRDQLLELASDETLTDQQRDDALRQALGEPTSQAVYDDDGGDYAELVEFADDVLRLAYGGRRYQVPACSVEIGELAVVIVGGQRAKATPRQQELVEQMNYADLYRAVLGGDQTSPLYDADRDVFRQLTEAGASWKVVEHFAYTAMLWAVENEAAARTYFTGGQRAPKAAVKQPQDRKPATPKAGTANSTRRRAYGSSTTRRSAAKAATPGEKS